MSLRAIGRYLLPDDGLSGQPALPQILRLPELGGVRAVAGRACGFEHRGEALQARVREEDAHLLADLSLEDVRVPVAVRSERRFGVVDVERAELLEPDRGVELVEARVERGRIGHVH